MYLGLDCGTSGLKALLTDERGAPVASALRAYSPDRPRAGWSEQDPEVWSAAMAGAIADLRNSAGKALGALKAIGFSGQMHGAVLLDGAMKPVRPAILHNDARADGEAQELASEHPGLARIVGVKPMPGFTGPKLKWIARHEPDIRRRTAWLLSPKDYLRLKLGGELLTDMSDAAGTWLLDEAARAWSAEAFAACEADPAWAPRLIEGSAAAGQVGPKASDELGLPRGVALAAGGGDAAVGAIGLGAITPGQAFISLGTATQLIVATDRYISAPEKVVHSFAHALPNRWYAMAAMLNGAGALAFAGRLLGAAPETLEREAAADYHGPGGLLFLPYLSGERTPLDDASCAGRDVRPERDDGARRRRPRGDGGRCADARGRAQLPGRRGRFDRAGRPHRRRREEPSMDSHDCRGDRLYRRSHAGRRNRPGSRRRAPRPDGRNWRIAGNRLPAARNRRRDRAGPKACRDVCKAARAVQGALRRGEGRVSAVADRSCGRGLDHQNVEEKRPIGLDRKMRLRL